MSWISLSTSDILASLNEAEATRYREIRGDTEADPITAIMADVTAEVRGYVAVLYPIDASAGIPHALKNAAVDICIYRLAKRCQTDTVAQRKAAADDAVRLLEKVASGKFVPDAEATTSAATGPGTPTITARDQEFDRESQDGL